MKNLKVTASSQIGCVRSNNEDMVLVETRFLRNDVFTGVYPMETNGRIRHVFAVADGMGGHQAGEVASADALINFEYFVNDLPEGYSAGQFEEAIINWLASINRRIATKGQIHDSLHDMGTTLVALVVYGGRFYRMNCGDSRLYIYSEGKLQQLTVDHSLNTMMGEQKHSNIITNCIGAGCTTSYIDISDITDTVKPGDRILLCSDGLNDMVDDEDIAALLGEGADADALCQAAVKAGGYDNVSVCVVDVE